MLFWRRYILFLFVNNGIIIFVSVILKKTKIIFIYFICVVAKFPEDKVPIVLISVITSRSLTETASTAVTSIRRRNDIEKSTWRTHQYFVDLESRIHDEISTSNRCHNFHVDSPSKSIKLRRTFHVKFRYWMDGESTKICTLGYAWKMLLLLLYHA